tara:strand:+ start:121 stop:600 length:480 start_codon:yes stop_codon:yes gene_type:complete
MNNEFNIAIKDICAEVALKTMTALSEKYGFDEEEAKEFLKIKDIKIVHGRGSTSKSEKKKVKKEKSEKPKTKRGMSGYNLYNREERATVVEELEKNGEEFTSKDVMSILGPRWKALDEDVKKEWSVKAKSLNKERMDGEESSDVDSEKPVESDADDNSE